jgi:GH15 family glucan-1,4-alpha-glucosidase
MSKHVYDFGVIGNCAYLAYVDRSTNVGWMCWPRFDSSFVFGRLLDTKKGGEFTILPESNNYESKQYYVENTNVLCTEIETASGRYRITDFAPRFNLYDRYYKPLMLVRKIEPLDGTPQVKVSCNPVGDYGNLQPKRFVGSNHIEFTGLEQSLRLTTNISLSYIMENKSFVLNEPKYLVLTCGLPLEAPLETTAEDFLRQTKTYWRKWVKNTSIGNYYQAEVIRSALVLKIHQYEDTGAIIAAGTTSLPEAPGSTRNWDYRFCWLRDTYYTLNAFNSIGHFDEVESYFHYIENISVNAKDRFQPLYSITGQGNNIEKELDLEGYLGNTPVRIGNDAYTHIQNDVYGQVLISLLPLYVDRRFVFSERTDSKKLIMNTLEKIKKTMHEKDAGLWEFRNLAQYHCYTYLFHWAGANAAYNIGKVLKNDDMIKLGDELRKEAASMIEQCYDKERGVYTQAIGTKNLDASTLQLIMMNYLDPKSDRAKSHLRALEEDLKASSGLFYRYKHADDFGEPETTFMICGFWYVEALATVGRVEEAMEEFETLVKYTNHLGLLSEDVDAHSGSQWGNFPQAYSHVGLMNAAYRISTKIDKPDFLW